MQQTRRTVAQQSKFARGERAPGAGPARPQGEGGQGPLAGALVLQLALRCLLCCAVHA